MPHLISASRRTDIPRFYAEWFAERRRAGFVAFRNGFGGRGEVSLRDEDVLGYLFWTRDPRPLRRELSALRGAGVPYALQVTITGYGPDLEPRRVPLDQAVEAFRSCAADLPGPGALQWRYDPIVLTERYDEAFHRRTFRDLAAQLAGATVVVNTSVVEPYLRAVRRLGDRVSYRSVDPSRHKTVAKLWPALPSASERAPALVADLVSIAREHGLELRACANPDLDLPRSQCVSAELFSPWGESVRARVEAVGRAPSRGSCRCLRSIDIGANDTCPAGCRYCYAVQSERTAIGRHEAHDPKAPSLC